MNLARMDLNLLVALDALLQHRSVTRAAEHMGLTQPALSASLARLRRHFGDDLLTRVGNEYRPTPLAIQLQGLVKVALGGVERVLTAQPGFDPATSTRQFTLLVSDYVTAVLGEAIADLLTREAPHTRLRLVSNVPAMVEQAERALLTADLMLMPHGFVTDMSHHDLYTDEWVCIVTDTHPAADRGLTIDDLTTLPWVATYHSQTASTPAARQMRMLGIEPHIQIVTENFLTVPRLIAGSDRIALLQRRLVDLLPRTARIRALPCPFDVAPLIEAMWWHPVHDNDPEHAYLRDLVIRATARAVPPHRP